MEYNNFKDGNKDNIKMNPRIMGCKVGGEWNWLMMFVQ
jgi:hypothetical protein